LTGKVASDDFDKISGASFALRSGAERARLPGLAAKAADRLGWRARSGLSEVIERMIGAEQCGNWPMTVS